MFLHVDLDAFFASVEQLDFPQYRGKPVIVGGDPNARRGVVSTCSYEARKFGIHSAMSSAQAKLLCPNGIFLKGRMERYHEKSQEVMKIFDEFSPDVQQISIDEAFIDLTGTERLFGPADQTARLLKTQVKEKTGLTVSVGLASNKYVAKIASGILKPDGFFFVKPGTEADFMQSLPLDKLWGVGSKTIEKLKNIGLFSIKEISNTSETALQRVFGISCGTFLYNASHGRAAESFDARTQNHSISAERTYPYDLTDSYIIETALMQLCEEVRFRLETEGYYSKTVHIKIRYGDFSTTGTQKTFQNDIDSFENLFKAVKDLFYSKWHNGYGIRLLGVGMQNCSTTPDSQGELFAFDNENLRKLEKTIINHNSKKNVPKIQKARLLSSNSTLKFED
ncbi:MAG: DNA polymerase IV [Treponema sp.]|nr:DNA polymerase IV [Treponema sp.]